MMFPIEGNLTCAKVQGLYETMVSQPDLPFEKFKSYGKSCHRISVPLSCHI